MKACSQSIADDVEHKHKISTYLYEIARPLKLPASNPAYRSARVT